MPAVQHRAVVDAELRRARQRGHPSARRRRARLRRPAPRRLLRRPRIGLRPRQPASVPAAARAVRSQHPRADAPRARCERDQGRQRALDRAAAAEVEAARERRLGHRPDEPRLRDRRLDHGEPAEGARARPRRDPEPVGSVRAGVAARQPAVQRSARARWSTRTTGTRNRRPTTSSSPTGSRYPELAKLLPVLYPGVFPNLAALNASRKPRADLLAILLTGHPDRCRSPGSRTSPGRRRPTCCGSTSRSRRSRTSPATWVCSAATSPASRTAGASSTTCSRSSCARSRASPTRSSTRRSRPTARPPRSPTGSPRTSSTRPRRAP